jgi:hypothetical protein
MVNLSPQSHPINVSTLAKRIGVTRQAIYNNQLLEEISQHADLQRQMHSVENERTALRRPLEQRLVFLEAENKELRGKLEAGFNAGLRLNTMPGCTVTTPTSCLLQCLSRSERR